jgi:hypothetical protein
LVLFGVIILLWSGSGYTLLVHGLESVILKLLCSHAKNYGFTNLFDVKYFMDKKARRWLLSFITSVYFDGTPQDTFSNVSRGNRVIVYVLVLKSIYGN